MLCWRRNPRKWRKQRRQVPLVRRGQHGISASSWKSFSGRGWFCFWMKIVMAFVLRAVNFWGINDLTHQTITCRQLLQRHLTWSTGIKAVGTKKFGAFNFYSVAFKTSGCFFEIYIVSERPVSFLLVATASVFFHKMHCRYQWLGLHPKMRSAKMRWLSLYLFCW